MQFILSCLIYFEHIPPFSIEFLKFYKPRKMLPFTLRFIAWPIPLRAVFYVPCARFLCLMVKKCKNIIRGQKNKKGKRKRKAVRICDSHILY